MGAYPSIETVLNQARVHINDTFTVSGVAGAGRIFQDSWPVVITILGESLKRYQRDIEHYGVRTTRVETLPIAPIPVINGPQGQGVPDPSVQQNMNFKGFFDGLRQNLTPSLPPNLLQPLEIWQRQYQSNSTYTLLDESADALPSVFQNFTLGSWQWRGDAIYFNGSLTQMDIRLSYRATRAFISPNIQPNMFSSTMLPFLDCDEPLAYLVAYKFSSPRIPPSPIAVQLVQDLLANYQSTMVRVANRWVKAAQRTPVGRASFGYEGDAFGW